MDNVVTLETAKRLKQAGFPQPEPKVGQFWYDGMFQRLSIASHRMGKDQHLYLTPINAVDWSHYFEAVVMLDDKNDWPIFAPTATDILREMPGAILVLENYGSQGKVWEVWKNGGLIADLENPAEAAAFAWLTLNEK